MALLCLGACQLPSLVWSEAHASWVLWEEELTAESSEPIHDFVNQAELSRSEKIPRQRVDSEAECLLLLDVTYGSYFRSLTQHIESKVVRGPHGLLGVAIGRKQWIGVVWSCVQDNERERGAIAPSLSDAQIAEWPRRRAARDAQSEALATMTPATREWAHMFDTALAEGLLNVNPANDRFPCVPMQAWLDDHQHYWGGTQPEALLAYFRSGHHDCP